MLCCRVSPNFGDLSSTEVIQHRLFPYIPVHHQRRYSQHAALMRAANPEPAQMNLPVPDVRQEPGYAPQWDLDVKVGQRGESYLQHIVAAMLHGDEGTIEVKTDDRAITTGNVFIEYMSKGNPSGIDRTQATLWATVIGGVVVIVPTQAVKEVVAKEVVAGNVRHMGRGSHPTVGVVIPISDYIYKAIEAAPSIGV